MSYNLIDLIENNILTVEQVRFNIYIGRIKARPIRSALWKLIRAQRNYKIQMKLVEKYYSILKKSRMEI